MLNRACLYLAGSHIGAARMQSFTAGLHLPIPAPYLLPLQLEDEQRRLAAGRRALAEEQRTWAEHKRMLAAREVEVAKASGAKRALTLTALTLTALTHLACTQHASAAHACVCL